MPRSAAFSAAILRHALHGAPLPPPGESLYFSLHTAAPGSDQSASEAGYAGYRRVAVPVGPAAWSVADHAGVVTGDVQFPACTGGRAVLTHWAVGTDPEGPGLVLWSGELDPPVEVSRPVQPYLPAGAAVVEA